MISQTAYKRVSRLHRDRKARGTHPHGRLCRYNRGCWLLYRSHSDRRCCSHRPHCGGGDLWARPERDQGRPRSTTLSRLRTTPSTDSRARSTRNRGENLERAQTEFHVGNLYFNRKCTGAMVGAHPFGGFNMSGHRLKSWRARTTCCSLPRPNPSLRRSAIRAGRPTSKKAAWGCESGLYLPDKAPSRGSGGHLRRSCL